jgi:alkanesulfonate monooxygenase SsuD/methylene tetrahydromethanopterin reductase-like flavin-dependent oxidoreductase (luciferase family)
MRFGLFWQTPGSEGSAESVFYPTRPMSNPLTVAIAAAQRTRRLRCGTLATQTPLHHPFSLAIQSATCDLLTNGGLDLRRGGGWRRAPACSLATDVAEFPARGAEKPCDSLPARSCPG